MPKVLITGVNGFVGSALGKYLAKKPDLSIVGLDRACPENGRNIIVCDMRDVKKLSAVLTRIRPDFIFHCAGGREQKKYRLSSNVSMTKFLLDSVFNIPDYAPKIVVPGSAAEYGRMPRGTRRLTEDDAARPLTRYGKMKLKQTQISLRYARRGMNIVVARVFNIIGEGIPSSLSIGAFAKQLVEVENKREVGIIYTEFLDTKRDFLDIKDVCRGLWAVARHGKPGQIYNICSGKSKVMRSLLRKLMKYSSKRDIQMKENNRFASSNFDVVGSNAKLKKISGWLAKVSLENSIKNALNSYREKNENINRA